MDVKDNLDDMTIVRWVWIGLNIILTIYAIALYVYAKYWPKKEIRNYVTINNTQKSFIEDKSIIPSNESVVKKRTAVLQDDNLNGKHY